ncbi:MAG: DeoR/GlpR transcriptional regulator [Methylobacterium mesophilicum]|nr:DeoR/GlpR transcriptional regulator [Methylobacterium mesophilicum]
MKDDRLTAIRQHLYSKGFSSVQDISEAVGASHATIRRDLLVLEAEGVVARAHGGARIATSAGVEVAFAVREQENLAAKRAIADAAFELIEPHSSVFLDAGTTVLQLARRLRLDPMPLSVFTNGLVVAQALTDIPRLNVTVIGGMLRSENASMVGAAAESMIERLWFDRLFLGAGAIADDNRLYSLDENEARLNERMMARSNQTALLVDASKFGRHLTYLVAPLSPELQVITDASVSPGWRSRLNECGCATTVVATPLASVQARGN